MKKTGYEMRIAKPCHQSWEGMTESEKGKFCEACAKQVIDLTRLSDHDLLKLIENNAGKFCGRANTAQLHRLLVGPAAKRLALSGLLAGVLILSSANSALLSNTPIPIEISPTAAEKTNAIPLAVQHGDATGDTLRGKLMDADTHEEIPFATVLIKDTKMGAITNAEGVFKLHVPAGAFHNGSVVVQFYYIGYETQEVTFHEKDFAVSSSVFLKGSVGLMGEVEFVPVKKNKKGKKK